MLAYGTCLKLNVQRGMLTLLQTLIQFTVNGTWAVKQNNCMKTLSVQS